MWREKNHAGHDYQTGPSIRLIISTDAIGPFDRILLNELGAITECLAFRRTQREYTPYPIIPVRTLPSSIQTNTDESPLDSRAISVWTPQWANHPSFL